MRKTQQTQAPSAPSEQACLSCAPKGIYVSVPIYLTDPDGKTDILCYRAQCPFCRAVKLYQRPDGMGLRPGVYKLTGKTPNFRADLWPEVRKYRLNPQTVIERIFDRKEQRYFTLSDFALWAAK